jgi:predicted ABC-type transport system involved in lysophospholipase L1 biosynthesis ATPase subunit
MIKVLSRQKGLGDTVAMVTTYTGIKFAIEQAKELGIIGDCGCNERQEKLNNMFPYGNKGEDSEILR